MSDRGPSPNSGGSGESLPEGCEQPRGTLAIVFIFGALFALGWASMFVWAFLKRGGLHQ